VDDDEELPQAATPSVATSAHAHASNRPARGGSET
jgi:hypothetical protein